MTIIFHITSQDHWQIAQREGTYQADSMATVGFIHAATQNQVSDVANCFYQGQGNLIVLRIDSQKLDAEVRWEAPVHPQSDQAGEIDGQQKFPHIYGAINLDAVQAVMRLVWDDDGRFKELTELPV